jgi:glycosyltransferase involved in cell wall biosynthesis
MGKIPYHEVQNHIKNAHVCVFPSFAETLGMVTIESMALQRPVVNTNIGWAKELIEEGVSGYLVHPEDTQAYADTIVTLFEDKTQCLSLGKQARDRVERFFDISKQAEKNIAFYKKIVGS